MVHQPLWVVLCHQKRDRRGCRGDEREEERKKTSKKMNESETRSVRGSDYSPAAALSEKKYI